MPRIIIIFLLVFALSPSWVQAAIYPQNPPVLNKRAFAYLNQYVGKYILRTAKVGENGATQDQYKSCTATLISPTWILTAAHCLRRELGVPSRPTSETRFRIYHDPKDVENYTSYGLTGTKIIGQYPNIKHQDWAFFELASPIVRDNFPKIVSTTAQQWHDLNKNVFFVGFLSLSLGNQSLDDQTLGDQPSNIFSSRQVRTSKFPCATSKFAENIFITYPNFVISEGIIEADNQYFGASDCPSTVTSSGAPLFDQDGNIRAIDSFGSDPNQVEYFGEHKVNIHILSNAFIDAYNQIMGQ